MKILYVTTVSMTMGFFPDHIRMLQTAGHTVELACNMEEPLADKVTDLGCKAHHIPFSRSPLSSSNISAYRELKRIIADGDYDIVHTHTPIASALVRVACRKMRKNGLKVIYTAHGFHFCKGAPFINWLIYYPIEKICSRWTDVQITITKEDYQRAKKKLHAKKTVYIPGVGVDLNKFTPGDEWIPGSRRAELGIPEDAKLLLSVGELNENKNHATVLAALNELKDNNIYYVVCGEGGKHAELERMIDEYGLKDRAFLLGVRRDVAQWMADADIYVHPSFREGLSVSTMEAMTSGLPVICGDIRGSRDLIQNERGGILCNPAEAKGFAKAIRYLMDDDEKRTEMGEHNRESVKNFSLERVLEGLEEVYGVSENERTAVCI